MTSNFNDISYIESYLKGEMSGAELQAFEQQLKTDAALQQEVSAYRQILDGLQGLKEVAFEKEIAKWTNEARSFSSQTIEPARIVSIKKGAKLRSRWVRAAAAAVFVLLTGAATVWWTAQRYATIYMVEQTYSPPLSSGTMGGQPGQVSEMEKNFEQAHQFFQKGNYTDAFQQFDAIVISLESNPGMFDRITRKFYLDNAKWTRLLARFANGDLTDEQFSNELDAFANDPASDYAEKAGTLKKDIHSFWRKISH